MSSESVVRIFEDTLLSCAQCKERDLEDLQSLLHTTTSTLEAVRLTDCSHTFIARFLDFALHPSVQPRFAITRIKIAFSRPEISTALGVAEGGHEWRNFLAVFNTTLRRIEVSTPHWEGINGMAFWTPLFEQLNESPDLRNNLERVQAPCLGIDSRLFSNLCMMLGTSMPNLSVLDTRGIPMSSRETSFFAQGLESNRTIRVLMFGGNDTWASNGVATLCNFLRNNHSLEQLFICTDDSNLIRHDDTRTTRQVIKSLNQHPSLTSFGLYLATPKRLKSFGAEWASARITTRISTFNIRHQQEPSPLGTYDEIVVPALKDILVGLPFLQNLTLNLKMRPSIQETQKLIQMMGDFPRLRSFYCSVMPTPNLDARAVEKWCLATIQQSGNHVAVQEMAAMIVQVMGVPQNIGELITSYSETIGFSGILSWHYGPPRDPYTNPVIQSALESHWRGDTDAVMHRRRSNVFFE